MLDRNANRPRFTEEEARKIAESKFGVKGSVKELPSERDLNYHVRTELGVEYVLKIAAKSEKSEILDMQNRAYPLTFLSSFSLLMAKKSSLLRTQRRMSIS
jgi:Ser/Thr protein kinase RdoA (MazF antagonist)